MALLAWCGFLANTSLGVHTTENQQHPQAHLTRSVHIPGNIIQSSDELVQALETPPPEAGILPSARGVAPAEPQQVPSGRPVSLRCFTAKRFC